MSSNCLSLSCLSVPPSLSCPPSLHLISEPIVEAGISLQPAVSSRPHAAPPQSGRLLLFTSPWRLDCSLPSLSGNSGVWSVGLQWGRGPGAERGGPAHVKCTQPWKTLAQRKCPDGPAAVPGMLLTIAVGSFHHLLLPPAPQENRKDMSSFMFPFCCCCLKKELCKKHAPPPQEQAWLRVLGYGRDLFSSLLKPHARTGSGSP